jgi:Tfp pilus assembly protein PilF
VPRRTLAIPVLLAAALLSLGAGRAPALVTASDGGRPGSDDWHEAVVLVFVSGVTSGGMGNGLVFGDGTWVATAAHVVLDTVPEGKHQSVCLPTVYSHALGDAALASVAIIDEKNDVALLRVPWPGHPTLALATAEQIRSIDGAFAGAWAWGEDQEIELADRLREVPLYLTVIESREEIPGGWRTLYELPLDQDLMERQRGQLSGLAFRQELAVGEGWSGAPLVMDREDTAVGMFTGYVGRDAEPLESGWRLATAASIIAALARRAEAKGGLTSVMEAQPFTKRERCAEAFAHAVKAAIARDADKWEQSEPGLSEAQAWVDLRPDSARAHEALAAAAKVRGDNDLARQHYLRALEIAPHDVDTRLHYAAFLRDAGEPEQALIEARRAAAMLPESVYAAPLLSELLCTAGQPEEAEKELRRALSIEPLNLVLWIDLYQALSACERWKDAVAAARKATELDPRDGLLWVSLGYSLERTGALDEAEKDYHKAFALRPNDASVCLAVADFLASHRPERNADARILFNSAIALDTDHKIPPEAFEGVRAKLEGRDAAKSEQGAVSSEQ